MAGKNYKELIAEENDAMILTKQQLIDEVDKAVANYHAPKGEILEKQIEWFRDQKFGLMVHWGLYCQMGMKESWPLVDNDWSKWQFRPGTKPIEVKEMYSQLHKGFLPLRFDPEEWADIAYEAGFRYLVFTTKHHDGFCMRDTKTTDYKVTGTEVPWRDNKNADITKALFDAFRAKGMGISAYFSRADFACPYYWEPGYFWKDGTLRVPSYDPDTNPELWKKFQDFVYAQLEELVTQYGHIDSLWYDGGCDGVKLGLPEMTEKLRRYQPWMLGVIRGGGGVCEDIVTPECLTPPDPIFVPWEACTVMGIPQEEYGVSNHVSFGYTYDQDYMSAKQVAHLLLDIVAKGGNLALNIAPQPDGRLPHRAVDELKVLSKWMAVFGPAIHGTRAVAPYRTGQWAFTGTKDSKQINAFFLYGDDNKLPAECIIPVTESNAVKVTDMRTGANVDFTPVKDGIKLSFPEDIISREGDIADCFNISVG